MQINSVKLKSGEELILEVKSENTDSITVCSPMLLIPAQDNQFIFYPYMVTAKIGTEMNIPRDVISVINDAPSESFVEEYKKTVGKDSGIVMPPRKEIITG